jgi:hypothetical protein
MRALRDEAAGFIFILNCTPGDCFGPILFSYVYNVYYITCFADSSGWEPRISFALPSTWPNTKERKGTLHWRIKREHYLPYGASAAIERQMLNSRSSDN